MSRYINNSKDIYYFYLIIFQNTLIPSSDSIYAYMYVQICREIQRYRYIYVFVYTYMKQSKSTCELSLYEQTIVVQSKS